jgi:molecular chaperone GrpE (heat shock protein)
MDEDGVSLDSYDEYVRCNWCGEVFTVDQCIFEANMGWLCDRCYQAILSRGEKLTIIKNPTDEDIAKTLTEEVKMTAKELKDKFGTDDVDLINAGREPEERVELAEAVSGEIEMPFSDLSKEEQEYIKAFTKFINDAIANKTELTADDILKFKDNYSKNIVNKN